ncbi:uncharacterized protein SPPG_05716 [Spizellomyces punctatus DAOM BR117]|uniref:Uncharacterized protein n=1 Tax=Spizellomyces punctatus (strain DAOM BR117) TaxID=645134 RepID=A0A0L0HEF4_SPIPD|nr:uncharacterized protein SPPG_05716 [Spizellomyces punctatus DAOM BR117]KNC99482.1 hypothetical protein SPPG_05716 [Spizellomyces punctatus DAOM BR117]|eukprot:XP_016607522.1 hypothetical protein SPPG_05716 [Spizellomyces punctatus DAOM BR117]
MSPHEAIEKPYKALINLERYWEKMHQKEPEIFSIGDHVRVKHEGNVFKKAHRENFSSNVYRIGKVIKPFDKLRSYRYVVEGIPDRIFNYNELIKTEEPVTIKVAAALQKRDRLQKQAARELEDLIPVRIQPARTRAQQKKLKVRPKGTFSHIEIPRRKMPGAERPIPAGMPRR